jgi:hypothetical protein
MRGAAAMAMAAIVQMCGGSVEKTLALRGAAVMAMAVIVQMCGGSVERHYIRNAELFNLNHSFITILFTELIAAV